MIKDINLYFLSQNEKNKVENRCKKRSVFLVLIGIFLMHYISEKNKDVLEKTNKDLKKKIEKIQENSSRITVLKKQIKSINDELIFIKDLQNNRQVILGFFKILPRIVPVDIRLNKIILDDHKMTLEGTSESAASITRFMDNLEGNRAIHRAHLLSFRPDELGVFELEFNLFL